MTRNPWIVAGLAMTALIVVGCTARPVVDPGGGIAPESPFCKLVPAFREVGLNSSPASNPSPAADPAQVQRQSLDAQRSLQAMAAAVGNQGPSDQLKLLARTFGDVAGEVGKVTPKDNLGFLNAVNAAMQSNGADGVNKASAVVDSYVATQCGLSLSPRLTTTTTTAAPQPTAPTVPSSTGNNPVGPVGPALPTSTTR